MHYKFVLSLKVETVSKDNNVSADRTVGPKPVFVHLPDADPMPVMHPD